MSGAANIPSPGPIGLCAGAGVAGTGMALLTDSGAPDVIMRAAARVIRPPIGVGATISAAAAARATVAGAARLGRTTVGGAAGVAGTATAAAADTHAGAGAGVSGTTDALTARVMRLGLCTVASDSEAETSASAASSTLISLADDCARDPARPRLPFRTVP
jgi:hypothetical protein